MDAQSSEPGGWAWGCDELDPTTTEYAIKKAEDSG